MAANSMSPVFKMAERILYTELTSYKRTQKKNIKMRWVCGSNHENVPCWLFEYLFSEANVGETLLNGIKLLLVQFTGDNVLHYFGVLTVDVPAGQDSVTNWDFHSSVPN